MKKENLAIIEMLVCATLWSIAGIFIKLIPWNGFAVAGMRSLIAGATIAVYMLISRHRFVLSKKTFLAGVLSACVYTCFVCANKLTTAANAIVLQFTSPVFIVIFTALIYKTRIRKADAAVVTLTLLGIALFSLTSCSPAISWATWWPSPPACSWPACSWPWASWKGSSASPASSSASA